MTSVILVRKHFWYGLFERCTEQSFSAQAKCGKSMFGGWARLPNGFRSTTSLTHQPCLCRQIHARTSPQTFLIQTFISSVIEQCIGPSKILPKCKDKTKTFHRRKPRWNNDETYILWQDFELELWSKKCYKVCIQIGTFVITFKDSVFVFVFVLVVLSLSTLHYQFT